MLASWIGAVDELAWIGRAAVLCRRRSGALPGCGEAWLAQGAKTLQAALADFAQTDKCAPLRERSLRHARRRGPYN